MTKVSIDIDAVEFRRQFDFLLGTADSLRDSGADQLDGLLNMLGAIRDALEEQGVEVELAHDRSEPPATGELAEAGAGRMLIIRDGFEFELTPDELRAAYETQQHIYDKEGASAAPGADLEAEKTVSDGAAKSIGEACAPQPLFHDEIW